MKKVSSFLLLFLLILTISACGAEKTSESDVPLRDTVSFIQSEVNAAQDTGNSLDTVQGDAQSVILPADGEGGNIMTDYDFSVFTNVEITGVDMAAMNNEQLEVLYQQAKYCQAMTDADTDTLRKIVSEDAVFTHMSGRQQTREEYFADIEKGSLRYFTIGIDSPIIAVDGELASISYTSVLNANAYGARGTYRMSGTHWFEKQDGSWISINDPKH